MNSEKQKKFNNKKKRIFLWLGLLLILFLAAGLVFFVYNKKLQKQEKDFFAQKGKETEIKGKLLTEPPEINLKTYYTEEIKLFLENTETKEKKEVTGEAEWKAENANILEVDNEIIKGRVTGRKEGETKILVNYNGLEAAFFAKVENPKLEVKCAPYVVDKEEKGRAVNMEKMEKAVAKVGDKIFWQVVYIEIGSPHYTYDWTGTDGLESDIAMPEIAYDTPGLKKAKIFTEDMVGNSAEAECQIEIVE